MAKEQVIYVNQVKYKRAQDIANILTGVREAKPDEIEARETFVRVCAEDGVDLKKDDVVAYIYKKLGGFVSTVPALEERKEKAAKRNGVKSKAAKGDEAEEDETPNEAE